MASPKVVMRSHNVMAPRVVRAIVGGHLPCEEKPFVR